jgi:hypothetical protein
LSVALKFCNQNIGSSNNGEVWARVGEIIRCIYVVLKRFMMPYKFYPITALPDKASEIGDKMRCRGICTGVTIPSQLPIIVGTLVFKAKMVGVVVRPIQEHAIYPTFYRVGEPCYTPLACS